MDIFAFPCFSCTVVHSFFFCTNSTRKSCTFPRSQLSLPLRDNCSPKASDIHRASFQRHQGSPHAKSNCEAGSVMYMGPETAILPTPFVSPHETQSLWHQLLILDVPDKRERFRCIESDIYKTCVNRPFVSRCRGTRDAGTAALDCDDGGGETEVDEPSHGVVIYCGCGKFYNRTFCFREGYLANGSARVKHLCDDHKSKQSMNTIQYAGTAASHRHVVGMTLWLPLRRCTALQSSDSN